MDIMFPLEEEISLMIEIIGSAALYGGDYYSDWFCLETAIGAWVKKKGLEGQYAPNPDSYFSKIERITMRDVVPSQSRYYIELCDDEVGQFQECGIATSRPGVPFRLVENGTSKSLMPSFSRPEDKYGFYEIDYRRAEEDNACVFYKSCENGDMLVYNVPVTYLKKIGTNLDMVDYLVQKSGFFIESFRYEQLVARNKKDPQRYFSLRRGEELRWIPDDCLDLCKQIRKILWEYEKK